MLHNTLKKIRARRDGEEGFTLIELMVVVLIIAILIAIAIPTFLGAKSRAQDKAAQSNVRNGITAAKTVFSDHQDYADADPGGAAPAATALQTVEPSLDFVAAGTASTTPKTVSVAVTDTQGASVAGSDTIYMASLAKSGKCWAARDFQGPATTNNITVGTSYAQVPSGTACSGTGAAGLPSTAWADAF